MSLIASYYTANRRAMLPGKSVEIPNNIPVEIIRITLLFVAFPRPLIGKLFAQKIELMFVTLLTNRLRGCIMLSEKYVLIER
jgi:hypothetical protein